MLPGVCQVEIALASYELTYALHTVVLIRPCLLKVHDVDQCVFRYSCDSMGAFFIESSATHGKPSWVSHAIGHHAGKD